jgi:crotonobetainyl-CoA:carnitine CoA-transferase CaiB-like acyl-CoA transferase
MNGALDGIRVIELADEQAEHCGLLLAGLGAEVVKIEPPGGSPTRRIGPFYEDREDPEHSLYFWQYNRGKRSLLLDLEAEDGRARLGRLLKAADVLLHSGARVPEELLTLNPRLITARMTPFGEEGPWAHYKGSDLVHLALGGVAMNCGYDPEPDGRYDLPPIAPQMWQAYHIAGEQLAVGILAALLERLRSGRGQQVSCAVHQAVSTNTELDVITWTMRRAPLYRHTGRHADESRGGAPTIGNTKDGRWILTFPRDDRPLLDFLRQRGVQTGSEQPAPSVYTAGEIPGSGMISESAARNLELAHRLLKHYSYQRAPWREAQQAGLFWAPLRKPQENLEDEHWLARGSFAEVEHPELGHGLPYPVSKWISTETAWQAGRRAPRLDEDTGLQWTPAATVPEAAPAPAGEPSLSRRGKPFALEGVRILDFTWYLATAGGTRFLAALGADCIKVEWKAHPDSRRGAMAPVGGRAAREAATGPLPGVSDPEMGGQFLNKNPGKQGLSLNVDHPKGLEIARRLVALSDVVAEGFSPGVMERWGLGYESLRSIKPDIIYVQQSGFGSRGTYGRFRTLGPVAAAFSGLAEMSGLPEPAMPAAWGYSYLDWIGAYSFAQAVLAALYRHSQTGRGEWIDASQCESGLFLNGTALLDWAANGRPWSRIGNRSPFKPAAPHGIYRCRGEDRWLAVACFSEEEWRGLVAVAGNPGWAADPRFATLAGRLGSQDGLDAAVETWTCSEDPFELMDRLQAAGVPAGVCQTAEDRCDRDPQLRALGWQTEVTGSQIGRWPIVEVAPELSRTPAFVGGRIDRGAPVYGEDNDYVLGELLGFSQAGIAGLAEEGVI